MIINNKVLLKVINNHCSGIMNSVVISIVVMFAILVSFNHTFAQTNIEEEQYSQVSCEELDQFYKIIDKFVDWHGDPQISDEEYHTAQEVELAMVHDLGCEEYMAGADFELWSYDN